MFGASEYIKQVLPNGAVYSEIIWEKSIVNGGVNSVNIDYNKMGAKWVLINGLSISADNIGGAVNFIDAFNITLFSFFEFREATGIYDFWFLMKGSQLRLRCSSNTVLFSIGHQYVSLKEK